jgi:hypothetical protein
VDELVPHLRALEEPRPLLWLKLLEELRALNEQVRGSY